MNNTEHISLVRIRTAILALGCLGDIKLSIPLDMEYSIMDVPSFLPPERYNGAYPYPTYDHEIGRLGRAVVVLSLRKDACFEVDGKSLLLADVR